VKQIAMSLLALLFFGGAELRAASPVEEINAKVDKIDKLIKNGDKTLPSIETSYDFKNATEGVPPQFSFFFDSGTSKLVVCKIHVGHETWAKEFFYYFDENEDIQKYLEVVPASLFGPSASRSAIIYGKNGKVLWQNLETAPHQTPEEIKDLNGVATQVSTGWDKHSEASRSTLRSAERRQTKSRWTIGDAHFVSVLR
jgi:hypothetical protein